MRREVARPVGISFRVIVVRPKVLRLHQKLNLAVFSLLVNAVEIILDGRVGAFESMLLPFLFVKWDNDFVKRVVSQISSIVSEVVTPENQYVFRLVRLQSLLKQIKPVFFQVLGFLQAQNFTCRVILAIEPFLFGWLIMRHEYVSKNLGVALGWDIV